MGRASMKAKVQEQAKRISFLESELERARAEREAYRSIAGNFLVPNPTSIPELGIEGVPTAPLPGPFIEDEEESNVQ